MSVIAVMDIGKTNAKLSCVDAESGALQSCVSTLTRTRDTAPYPHLDTDPIWQWYLSTLQDLQTTATAKTTIDTIVVSAHGATAALLDDNGLVLPVMDYEFEGLDKLRDEYDTLCDPFEHTYSPKLPLGLNFGRQLFWQRRHCANEFSKARYLLPYAQYWSWKLTGVVSCEVSSIGSHSDLWNPIEKRYSDFAQQQGFATLFPERRFAGDILGAVSDEVTQATGINKDCKVLVGIHDSNASLVPWISSRAEPFTVMSTGTWVIIFSLGTPLEGLLAERDCTANVTIHSEPVACARFMGGREYGAIAGTDPATVSIADLIKIIDDDIYALPAFADTGGPYPGMAGRLITNRNLTATDRHALASLYCALVSDESLTLCKSRGEIIVEGAFAKNTLLLQCLAILRPHQKVSASADSTGTTMGAAMLATDKVLAPALLPAANSEPYLKDKILNYRKKWQQLLSIQSAKPTQEPA